MPPARSVGPGFSPLDERVALIPRHALTPSLIDSIVRLGARLPFAQVPELLAHFTGVTVSASLVRRLTEAAGEAAVAEETAEVDRIEQTRPRPPAGPLVQQLSVDGAMVPLIGGVWAEVKTLAVGTIVDGQTSDVSYCSRLTDADTFGDMAGGELHRRGTPTAGTVVAVSDGAAWCQSFVDLHRHDAVRILDFPHALEHLGQVAQALFGPGTETASTWLGTQAQALRHGREAAVLAELAAQADDAGQAPETRELLRQTHGYLDRRRDQIRYHQFAAAGYPIGSGCVESANKLVVEARLKGAGMHWARRHVNPMLALRTLVANDRWEAEWPAIWERLRHPPRKPPPAAPPEPTPPPAPEEVQPPDEATPRPKMIVAGKPTADHPWRNS